MGLDQMVSLEKIQDQKDHNKAKSNSSLDIKGRIKKGDWLSKKERENTLKKDQCIEALTHFCVQSKTELHALAESFTKISHLQEILVKQQGYLLEEIQKLKSSNAPSFVSDMKE